MRQGARRCDIGARGRRVIVVHGLKACDTCRRAMRALAEAGTAARLRDLRAEPVTVEEVRRWHARFGEGLLNRRSTTWRGLDAAARAGDPVDLMVAHPALIRRPVIEAADGLHLGWTPETRAALGLEG